MSGLIQDMPIRVCPVCQTVFIEDDQMYEEPWVCPLCGGDTNESPDYEGRQDDSLIDEEVC